jgi:hypothetical protein
MFAAFAAHDRGHGAGPEDSLPSLFALTARRLESVSRPREGRQGYAAAACSSNDATAGEEQQQDAGLGFPSDGSDGGANPKACPTTPPVNMSHCAEAGLRCEYDSKDGCCGKPASATFECLDFGQWGIAATDCWLSGPDTVPLCPKELPAYGSPCPNCQFYYLNCGGFCTAPQKLESPSCKNGEWSITTTWDYAMCE